VYPRARARWEEWARKHPVEYTFSSRASAASALAELRADQHDALVAVGAVSDTLENVAERLNTYAAHMPKQARWQAQLLVLEQVGERDVESALGDLHVAAAAARRGNELLSDVPGLLGQVSSPIREIVAGERQAVLESVDRQRAASLEFLRSEREASFAVLREERLALVESVRRERVEALKEADAIRGRAVDAALGGLRELVDYALRRLFAVLLLTLVSAAALLALVFRLAPGRRAASTPP
jgi:hypothetical protein